MREEDRIRIRRGLISRNEATVPVGRVRAVRVVEGLLRRPFGLCALTVEVTGYADEASAARTLFPLVRVRDVRAFLDEFLPEMADDVGALERPPRPRPRGATCCPPCCSARCSRAGAWFLVGPYALIVLALFVLYGERRVARRGLARPRRPAGDPLACGSPASPCSPPPGCASRTPSSQNVFQRRARPRRPVGRVRQEHDRAHPPHRGGADAAWRALALRDPEAVEQRVVGAPGAAHAHGEVQVDVLGQLALDLLARARRRST